MEHRHERARKPFSDIHRDGNKVRAVLLHDPTVEGLDVALYMDGSASMEDDYGPRGILAQLGGVENKVEPQMRWMLQYLATKDRNGKLRVAYWATGDGSALELLGELTAAEATDYKFPGPKYYGKGTVMLPAVRDFIAYIREAQKQGAKRGLAVFITDSQLYDADDVRAYSADVAKAITEGKIPPLNFVFVGVGHDVDEEQMEKIAHDEHDVGHLWCHRVADEMSEMAELVSVLVDESMTVAGGGVVTDEKGNVLKRYEARLPAVLEFDVPEECRLFALEIGGKRYEQPLPPPHEEDHDDDDDHDEPTAPSAPKRKGPGHHH